MTNHRADVTNHRLPRWTVLAALLLAGLLVPGTAAAGEHADGGYDAQVYRGEPDRQPDVDWVTAILSRGHGSRYQRQFCGGSLVAKRYVMTAAHCVTNGNRVLRSRRLEVLVGTKNLSRGGQVIRVRRVLVFPDYNPRTSYGDMALLRLRRPARYETASLVARRTHYVGQQGYIAGWGDRESVFSSRTDYPHHLHSAFIPIQPDNRCIRGGGNPDRSYDGSVMLCAGYERGHPDTCGGDSGGPLARRVNGEWRVVGVTSYGNPGCGSVGTYGVYAWVGSPILHRWLQRKL